MCGISGYIGNKEFGRGIAAMVATQEHRGPDFSNTFTDENFAALGHNRLSIIDLSPEANQPFQDATGRYVMVYNGEVYNYRELRATLSKNYNFKTQCDTEVVLAAYLNYGKDCLKLFNGMFAFAIWDTQEKKLFAARDRFGVKPFFYSKNKGDFYFASEIKAIRTVLNTAGFNEKVCAGYFAYGSYGMPGETFFEGIDQLPGGHYLEYNDSKLQLTRWYHFENEVGLNKTPHSLEAVIAQYKKMLEESISLRFRADVPVGINISGGIDSSLLLALVNKRADAAQIKAFSFYTDDNRYDELPWVEAMIAQYQIPLHKVLFTAEEVEGFTKKIAYFQDEPFGGIPTLAYAKIFETARQQGVKVLLDGQGMDEQWAGYDYYHNNSAQTIQGVQAAASPFKIHCLSTDFIASTQKPEYPKPFEDALLNTQYRDLFYTKIPRALRFNDRISMAFSTELREPFLDHRLVELAFSQPKVFKIHKGQTKYLLRVLLEDYAGKEITLAPKRPLQTPQREWLGTSLKPFVDRALEELLASPYAHWFDQKELQQEWMNYKKGAQDSSFHLWQWVNFSFLVAKFENNAS
jgi:asparagine synthase (glutamine-hydrolysing)